MNSEYVNLKYSGKLNLIKNEALRHNLVNFYEFYYKIIDELSEGHKLFVSTKVENYFQREFTRDTTNTFSAKEVAQRLKDREFINIINEQIMSLKFINENMYTDKIDDLLTLIDNEI